ncbi:GNAT family N-acetyltransferase [Psychroserpens sp. SPM9]|uniref:GNAT family N-acetyltransferase n=1 Tax=Psychroserpens sp. SPM9 TaxID=2975598 RepID=UPI0021A62116|nr:GNAT family N-acetyltransferase [Psychroserpens sp. SPM9]MDG5491859.1 GNAT family N-acetyltransferase [Psychroserpens sp. SPM9]
MEIQSEHNEKKGRFYYKVDGVEQAQMTYSRVGADKLIIDHTEVDSSLKGQGVGYKLVEAAVSYARDQQVKILPLCPFAAAVFKKRSEYNDVLF